ncbi:MAG: hypothetical protein KJ630_23510 [Proteobacteria bacterium]|nr:hypothetical protein [Pseudomonadota bacterium]
MIKFTTTHTGLKVHATLDSYQYAKEIILLDAEMKTHSHHPEACHDKLNYSIK